LDVLFRLQKSPSETEVVPVSQYFSLAQCLLGLAEPGRSAIRTIVASPHLPLGHGKLVQALAHEGTMAQLIDNSTNELTQCPASVEQRAHDLLAQHAHFRGRAGNFIYEYSDEVLIVRGSVPTFYLKQVLQTVLKNVEGVAWINNQVDVVSSDGVSSVRSCSIPSVD
jgi:hypothetical protein